MKLSKRAKRLSDGSIVIDEGDGYNMMAYRFEHPTNNQRLDDNKELKKATKEGFGDTLVSQIFGNPFTFVVVLWEHPNMGYFSDAGFFWKSMHRGWEFVPVVGWMDKYSIEMEQEKKSPIMGALKKIADKETDETLPTGINLFLKDYPEFNELFE